MKTLTAVHSEITLEDLTPGQREAVEYDHGPLLIVAGAGTGKTTVITRRIAWLIQSKRATPDEILALTFTEKASAEMEERVDLLLPYGCIDVTVRTFHAFGDELFRDHAIQLGLSPHARVLSKAEQRVLLQQHLFELPLAALRPAVDPGRYVGTLTTMFARAKDEAVSPADFLAYAAAVSRDIDPMPPPPAHLDELAKAYDGYQALLRKHEVVDFGDQILLAIALLEQHPGIAQRVRERFRYILVDEFQDTNYAQFRLLQLLAPPPSARVTVVADDDQSIYKWRGAAISNVLKFLETYRAVRTTVLTDNFRSTQAILDTAYRLIRHNDPDRLEVRRGIDKRLVARGGTSVGSTPHLEVFDTVSNEADWVARTIRGALDAGLRRPRDIAILVRSNRDADPFLRALNVAGVPWRFSGASGLFAKPQTKMLLSAIRTLADPADSLSWYHVAASPLYEMPMTDLTAMSAHARRHHTTLRAVLEAVVGGSPFDPSTPAQDRARRDIDGLDSASTRSGQPPTQDSPQDPPVRVEGSPPCEVSATGQTQSRLLLEDVRVLLELSRERSCGQLLYAWLIRRGLLGRLSRGERLEDDLALHTVAAFFTQLQRAEELIGPGLPEVAQHLDLLEAIGRETADEDDVWADRVQVLTIHKAKGLEFPVVFLVGLVRGRFPTPRRRDTIELPDALVKDLLPEGDYHLQEERRLFYVGLTRAKDTVYLTAAYNYGGKTQRKISPFIVEALDLATPSPQAGRPTAGATLEHARIERAFPLSSRSSGQRVLRLDAHGVDDYRTCPLKYRYSHVLRTPVMRHHSVTYGSALHRAVEAFFRRRLQGKELTEGELLMAFKRAWTTEAFLTREHEQARFAQGQETLRRFLADQLAHPEYPSFIELKFSFTLDDLLVVGRWDRVDRLGDQTVIIDYKSSDVSKQEVADRRARESIQLLIYSLAWRTIHGTLPIRTELRFLQTGLIGSATFTEDDLVRARQLLHAVANGIRMNDFQPTPTERDCHWCAFQPICPSAYQVR